MPMKLRDLVRKDPKELKRKFKDEKRKKRDVPDEWLNVQGDGLGDNAIRGMNDNEGYIQ